MSTEDTGELRCGERGARARSARGRSGARFTRIVRAAARGSRVIGARGLSGLVGAVALAALALAIAPVGSVLAAGEGPTITSFEVGTEEFKDEVRPWLHATRVGLHGSGSTGELEMRWRVEYRPVAEPNGPWVFGGSGTSSPHPQGLSVSPVIQHLSPSTAYEARLIVEDADGRAEASVKFTTMPAGPPELREYLRTGENGASCPEGLRHVGVGEPGTSAFCEVLRPKAADRVGLEVQTDGAETEYHFEYAEASGGPFEPFTAHGSGQITVAEDFAEPVGALEGLEPAHTYYVRVTASNSHGTVHSTTESFRTPSLAPGAFVDGIKVSGVGATVSSSVAAEESEAEWRLEISTEPGVPGSWSVVPGASGTITAAQAVADYENNQSFSLLPNSKVTGLSPETAYYVRLSAENGHEPSATSNVKRFETGGAPSAGTFALHALDDEAVYVLGYIRPHGYDTHYRFQYTPVSQFEAHGWEDASLSSEVDGGGGGGGPGEEVSGQRYGNVEVGEDLSGLRAGGSYAYRIVASNEAPGDPVVYGGVETLKVPTPDGAGGGGQACPNEALRTGPAAHLPDCRAYELVTPAYKGGAQDIFKYGARTESWALGEDGDHFFFHASGVVWGGNPGPGNDNYFFTRSGAGWGMVSATPHDAGPYSFSPTLFTADLTETGVEASFRTSSVAYSPKVELAWGVPGGPYRQVALLPSEGGVPKETEGWTAAAADGSKAVFATEYRAVIAGHHSSTASGEDLYEYSATGGLHQVNVLSNGSPISACGARMARGTSEDRGLLAGRHAVSPEGTRVFFTDDCTNHLYMRTGGETVDVGAYTLLAADASGTHLMLEKASGETLEVFSYDTSTRALAHLLSTHAPPGSGTITVSEDLSTIDFPSDERLTPEAPPGQVNEFSYDVTTGRVAFILVGMGDGCNCAQLVATAGEGRYTSPDGRYVYYEAKEGVPGLQGGSGHSSQVWRLDNAEDVVQCLSCASPFDSHPALDSFFLAEEFAGDTNSLSPTFRVASANGDYVFFNALSALVPEDVDGEVAPESKTTPGGVVPLHPSNFYSVSNDVYEWRANGVGGCASVQGCLSLITGGQGGYKNMLLGVADEGRDVFVGTHEQLVSEDRDTAGDVYDVRVDGGIQPPPPGAVECEGAACSAPAPAPADVTPSSFTFSGPGNVLAPALSSQTGKPKAVKVKKGKRRSRKRSRARRSRQARRSRRVAVLRSRAKGGSGR